MIFFVFFKNSLEFFIYFCFYFLVSLGVEENQREDDLTDIVVVVVFKYRYTSTATIKDFPVTDIVLMLYDYTTNILFTHFFYNISFFLIFEEEN